MSTSLRQLLGMNMWSQEKQEWQETAAATVAKVVETADGGNVQTALDAIPGQISDAIAEVRGGAPVAGNTLGKLHQSLTAIQAVLQSDDLTLDTVQEIVNYIKANKDALTLLGGSKINISDIANNLTTTATGKVLDARQGKALKDLIDALQATVSGLQTEAAGFATKGELSAVAANAVPTISDTPPSNPVDGQIWFKPIGTVEI